MYPLPASWERESYSEVVGGSLSLMWSEPIEEVGRSYLLLSGGPYMITNDDEGQAGYIFGPGIGVALGRMISVGLELNLWIATFEDTSTFIMPVRLFVRM
jgi:hypothetical protein